MEAFSLCPRKTLKPQHTVAHDGLQQSMLLTLSLQPVKF